MQVNTYTKELKMSRSFRKKPIRQYAPSSGYWGKKFANRRVRRYKAELSSGSAYKRLYEQWDIHDCWSRCTFAEYKEIEEKWRVWCWNRGRFCEACTSIWCTWNKPEKEIYNSWAKFYLRK